MQRRRRLASPVSAFKFIKYAEVAEHGLTRGPAKSVPRKGSLGSNPNLSEPLFAGRTGMPVIPAFLRKRVPKDMHPLGAQVSSLPKCPQGMSANADKKGGVKDPIQRIFQLEIPNKKKI